MTTLKINERPLFEIKELDDDRVIYQRVLKNSGHSKKQTKKRVSSLPTATVYSLSEVEFNRLKSIEAKLLKTDEFKSKVRKSLKDILFTFLEI